VTLDGVGVDRDLLAAEVPELLSCTAWSLEDAQGDGEDRRHLRLGQPPAVGMGDHADEGRDDEARAHCFDVVERAEHADVGGLEADLLVRLPQRGRQQIAVLLGMVATAGKGDLPAMVRQEV